MKARQLAPYLLAVLGLLGCDRDEGVQRLHIEESRGHWKKAGFVEMVPPLRLPRRSERNRTRVWLKLPDAGSISLRAPAGGDSTLIFPPGTVAARVEEIQQANGQFVAEDVRGTRLGPSEHFFVLRRVDRPSASLAGFEWERDNAKQVERATELLVELLAEQGASQGAQRHARANNDCAGCHPAARPANQRPRQHGVANRGTDGSGFYQPQTVLGDRVPVETYHPDEPNLDDPFITYSCPSGATMKRGGQRVSCSDGSVPWGELDVGRALTSGDKRVRDLCRARRYLYDRLDVAGQERFRDAVAACGGETFR